MADDVVVRSVVFPEKYQIFTENASLKSVNCEKMVQGAMETSSYYDMASNCCFSKCSAVENSHSPTSVHFSSDFCVEKDDDLPSCENEDNCLKKRCSDRYDSAESSDSGIAVSSGASSSSGNSDITDPESPGSPFSTTSDEGNSNSPVKSSTLRQEMSPNAIAPPPVFPSRRSARPPRPTESRGNRRNVRRPASADSQNKITEYFKSQVKPLVGIKRDYNYLKKESFTRDLSPPAKKSRDIVVEKPQHQSELPKLPKSPLTFLRQRPPAAKTLFNKILHNHKQRKLIENFLKARTEAKPINGQQTKQKTDEPRRPETLFGSKRLGGPGTGNGSSPSVNIRFPTDEGKTAARQLLHCRWSECTKVCDAAGPLLDHLQTSHVVTQGAGEKFVCLWVGCKVYDQKSCSRTWLERHVLTHAGNKPYRCIVDGCGQAFSTQSMLQRHVNHHFVVDAKKAMDSPSGPKPIRRCGRKVRYQELPWSARSDFFDEGMLQGLEHRLIQYTLARTGGLIDKTPPKSIAVTSEVISGRTLPNGERQFLLRWSPPDILDDEWVKACDIQERRVVPYHSLPAETVANIVYSTGLVRRPRPGRKTRPEPDTKQPSSPPIIFGDSRCPSPSPPEPELMEMPADPSPTTSSPTETAASTSMTESSSPAPAPTPAPSSSSPKGKVKLKRKRRSTKEVKDSPKVTRAVLPTPADSAKPDTNGNECMELVPVRSLPVPTMSPAPTALPPATTTASPSTSFILNSQQFKLVSQPFMNAMMPVPLTYQIQPQMQPQIQQPLYFLPQTSAPMFQTIHISSNIVQQQSILTSLNQYKSPTLLLVNTTKQVNVSLTQERPKPKVQILPKPECLVPLHPS